MPLKIFVTSSGQELRLNISANVGLRSPNQKVDVELVQFGYFARAQSTIAKQSAELRKLCAAIIPGAPYTGDPNDPLSKAIVLHQKERGGTQDGHISPIHGNSDFYAAQDGPHGFILGSLENNIRDLMPGDFPRIDKHPKCPAELRKAIIAIFGPPPP